MSYDQTSRQVRRSGQFGAASASAPVRSGALTYLVFALSVGFTGAVVLGFLV